MHHPSAFHPVSDDIRYPDYEIIEHGDDYQIRIAVPGLTNKEIEVKTIGTRLIVETTSMKDHPEGGTRLSGDSISPRFSMEFGVENTVTVGAPFLDHGVLTIPLRSNPEILMNVREYSIRELSKDDAVRNENGTDKWQFADAHK